MKADIELVQRDIKGCLANLFHAAERELVVASPYVGAFGIDSLCDNLTEDFFRHGKVRFLTDLSPRNICQSSTDPLALQALSKRIGRSAIMHLPGLHAKAYVADQTIAVIASANLTAGGLIKNYEYGVKITDSTVVESIRNDIQDYSDLGALIDESRLSNYCDAAVEIGALYSKKQKVASGEIVRQFETKIGEMEGSLIRYKLEGGKIHPVFEKTILYLLKKHGPLETKDLHPLIAAIHPDFCDDSVERIIDGVTFGKKWKHAARTAQQKLRKKGLVEYDGRVWRCTTQGLNPAGN